MGFSSQAGQTILRTQAVAGTYQADTGTAGVGLKLRSGSLSPTRELLIPDPEIGGGRDVSDAYLGAGAFSGDYEFYTRMGGVATLLYACLGTKADATVAATEQHTITPSDAALLPFLSIEEKIGAGLETYRYNDAVVNTLHLECEANGYLMGTAGIIAAKQIAGATPTASPLFDETPMIVGTNITVTYNSVSLPAKSFSLDINNNIEDDDFRLGSFYLGDLTPKRREITASFSLRQTSSAIWRQATYGTTAATQMGGLVTKQPLVITMSTYEVIGATVIPYSLTLTIPKFAYKPFAFDPSGDDIIENDVEGQALRPAVATPIMTALVVNSTATVA
jgi:hypothetical protein